MLTASVPPGAGEERVRGARALPALTSPLHTGQGRPVRVKSGRRLPAPTLAFDFADYQASVAIALATQRPLSALPFAREERELTNYNLRRSVLLGAAEKRVR